ncbi:MAG: hypothetical protein KKB57_08300 [Proteobacteria bacterium]|nr:hypothetical protein [Pseudomonadota bacterium]
MPRRTIIFWPMLLALALALALACAPTPAPAPPPRPELSLGSSIWDTPATRQSLALGGLVMRRLFPGEGLAAVFTGQAPGALVSRPLSLKPGALYRLRLSLRRQDFANDHYLWLNLWGVEHRLDAHCVVGGWQELVVQGRAPAGGQGAVAISNHTSSRLMLGRVSLEEMPAPTAPTPTPLWPKAPFAWGVYLNSVDHMEQAAALGFNLVVVGARPREVEALLTRAQGLGLRVVLHASPEPGNLGALIKVLGRVPASLRPLALYLVDEPEIRSFSLDRLLAARKVLGLELPWVRLVTAMVRPQQVARYAGVYDAVFMDQYPVPSQPLNWLADSIQAARGLVRPGGQVWAVVQGFGGGQYAAMGWSRPPTPQEAQALCVSALVSGTQGLLIYRWLDLSQAPLLKEAFVAMSRRLRILQPWLPLTPGLPPGMGLKHLGRVKSDPGGGPAVRTGWSRGPDGLLIMAVNTTAFRAEVALSGVSGSARQMWSGGSLPTVGGQLRCFVEPLGVRAWRLPSPAGGKAR